MSSIETSSSSSSSFNFTRPRSPIFSETLNNNLFMKNVIDLPSTTSTAATESYSSPSSDRKDNKMVRRSLEEISKEIKEIEDFLTITENTIKREKERDKELYARERQRRGAASTRTDHPGMVKTTQNVKGSQLKKKSINNGSQDEKLRILPDDKAESNADCFQEPQNDQTKDEVDDKPPTKTTPIRRRKSGSPIIKSLFHNGKVGCIENDRVTKLDQENAAIQQDVTTPPKCASPAPERLFEMSELNVVSTPIQDSQLEVIEIDDDNTCDEEFRSVSQMAGKLTRPPSGVSTTASAVTLNSEVKDKVRNLVRRFTLRTTKMRSRIEMPPTPSSSVSNSPQKKISHPTNHVMDALAKDPEMIDPERKKFQDEHPRGKCDYLVCPTFCGGGRDDAVLDPQGYFYISWLFVVSCCFIYNAMVIPLRSSFPFQTPQNTRVWMIIDYVADVVYLLDIIFVKHRIMYLFEGFWVKDKRLTRANYVRKLQFKLDILSLTPLDLLYFKLGPQAVWLRVPRLLKVQSFWEFFKLFDRVMSSPHLVRIAKTLTYMLFMIHLTACIYYAVSSYQGLGSNRWVFSGKGHPYVRCFVFATKTATSIGKNPKPENTGEFLFMTVAWLMGVFVFALLIGQIRDIISTATRSRSEYKQLEDETLEYMRRLNLPTDLRTRVKMWFTFTWEQQRALDENQLLDCLPANLKTEIAISVHIHTLSKVQLFADCEEALLRELVLKLRSVTFLPGDYVCRKGEVGKEMYIIKLGQVQVVGGPTNDTVLATLSEGSVFGEISLLHINGVEGNRRTADVKSRGYSNLFVLSKSDLNEAIVYYPNAQAILKRRARSLVRKNEAREREEAKRKETEEVDVVIGNPSMGNKLAPKLLTTVIQALPMESPAVKLLTHGSKRVKRKKTLDDTDPPDCQQVLMEATEKRRCSIDLLVSIQNELNLTMSSINLTDSEKALMMPGALKGSDDDDDDVGDRVKDVDDSDKEIIKKDP